MLAALKDQHKARASSRSSEEATSSPCIPLLSPPSLLPHLPSAWVCHRRLCSLSWRAPLTYCCSDMQNSCTPWLLPFMSMDWKRNPIDNFFNWTLLFKYLGLLSRGQRGPTTLQSSQVRSFVVWRRHGPELKTVCCSLKIFLLSKCEGFRTAAQCAPQLYSLFSMDTFFYSMSPGQ